MTRAAPPSFHVVAGASRLSAGSCLIRAPASLCKVQAFDFAPTRCTTGAPAKGLRARLFIILGNHDSGIGAGLLSQPVPISYGSCRMARPAVALNA